MATPTVAVLPTQRPTLLLPQGVVREWRTHDPSKVKTFQRHTPSETLDLSPLFGCRDFTASTTVRRRHIEQKLGPRPICHVSPSISRLIARDPARPQRGADWITSARASQRRSQSPVFLDAGPLEQGGPRALTLKSRGGSSAPNPNGLGLQPPTDRGRSESPTRK